MEVDVVPLAVAALPDACLLGLGGTGGAPPVQVLGEADVGDAGGVVPQQVDMGVEQDGVDRAAGLRQSCSSAGQTPEDINLNTMLPCYHAILLW